MTCYTAPKADVSPLVPGTHAEVRMKCPVMWNGCPGLRTVESAELTDAGNKPKLSMFNRIRDYRKKSVSKKLYLGKLHHRTFGGSTW